MIRRLTLVLALVAGTAVLGLGATPAWAVATDVGTDPGITGQAVTRYTNIPVGAASAPVLSSKVKVTWPSSTLSAAAGGGAAPPIERVGSVMANGNPARGGKLGLGARIMQKGTAFVTAGVVGYELGTQLTDLGCSAGLSLLCYPQPDPAIPPNGDVGVDPAGWVAKAGHSLPWVFVNSDSSSAAFSVTRLGMNNGSALGSTAALDMHPLLLVNYTKAGYRANAPSGVAWCRRASDNSYANPSAPVWTGTGGANVLVGLYTEDTHYSASACPAGYGFDHLDMNGFGTFFTTPNGLSGGLATWYPVGHANRPVYDPNPDRTIEARKTCTPIGGGTPVTTTASSPAFKETADPSTWPHYPAAPECPAGTALTGTDYRVKTTGLPDKPIVSTTIPTPIATTRAAHPECLGGACRLGLWKIGPAGSDLGDCFAAAGRCEGWFPASLLSGTELQQRRALMAGVADRFGELDPGQARAVGVLLAGPQLVVIEGAAGVGKTTLLAAAHQLFQNEYRQLTVVTPTRKAARVAAEQTGAAATSAAWLIHQHGYRWDQDGHWRRLSPGEVDPGSGRVYDGPSTGATLRPGGTLLVDEAGMLDQDTALALLAVADETRVRVAFLGDRHQLPAVGRGGVLDHAVRWVHPDGYVPLQVVRRFTDPDYADLSLAMRTAEQSEVVFDRLLATGRILVHATEQDRDDAIVTAAIQDLTAGREVIVAADTRLQVADLNEAIQQDLIRAGRVDNTVTAIAGLYEVGAGDRIITRRNDTTLGVANRDTWTVLAAYEDDSLLVVGPQGQRRLLGEYVNEYVELGYATTVHGAQGDTVQHAHLVLDQFTGAAAAYVGMTRGRESNTAHLVADSVTEAREQWAAVFSRDRADLGPTDAASRAAEDAARYGAYRALYVEAAERLRHATGQHELYRAPAPPIHGIGR